MMIAHAYKSLGLVCYILRLLVMFSLVLQICFYASVPESSMLEIANRAYPLAWSFQIIYSLMAIWVHLSVLYWSRVMVTK